MIEPSRASKCAVERHFAGHSDLIRRHPPLEEIGQFLHVLKVHERQRVLGVVPLANAQCGESLVGDELEVAAQIAYR